ncbi:hypothetical protein [Aerococcus viridans]|uniref:Uncharacterized protein n=2 Tax=Aerococcus viridans TaxID=1377 RepID=A0AAU8UJ81_9LACT|nr:hypothetical protein [Aerococcus viridans]AMC00371.1 hypothetical protein AWM76_01650 [Aerococcus viridans]EFG49831.1 hypothetical protein HMPREF0061_0757 [Aerococcus viridans ATCC 11563 = CCUG 4311]MEC1386794.1 hypothetical protein [Aerococcus viridans]SPT61193.1 Uncharacterised protein [Aerococcus viridans]SUU08893.1 Uncharacterised protein [Aerococcus viridans]
MNLPLALTDVPHVQTYVKAYDDKDFNLDILLEKIAQVPEVFNGVDLVDSFAGFEETRYASAACVWGLFLI